MELKKETVLYLILFLLILSPFAVYGFTMEEVLEEELIDADYPPEIKDVKPSTEETSDKTNKTTEKNDQQISVNKDSLSKESKEKTKSYFTEYWYIIIGIGAVVLLILILIYKGRRKKSANFGPYQNT